MVIVDPFPTDHFWLVDVLLLGLPARVRPSFYSNLLPHMPSFFPRLDSERKFAQMMPFLAFYTKYFPPSLTVLLVHDTNESIHNFDPQMLSPFFFIKGLL